VPSKNMLPKGHRHRSVRAEYVAMRGVEAVSAPVIPIVDLDLYERGNAEAEIGSAGPGKSAAQAGGPASHTISAPPEAAGLRLDQYLAQAIPDISRSRVQLLIDHGQVLVNGSVAKPKHRLTAGEEIVITGRPQPAPLHATAEDIPLEIIFEDEFLAVVNKPAGMMVHAGAAAPTIEPEAGFEAATEVATEAEADSGALSGKNSDAAQGSGNKPALRHDPRSSGTLVNALLHHFNHHLSGVGGELRPGIVHRLDKQTSGLLLVAKDDVTHRKLGEMFSARTVDKMYVALVHGHIVRGETTVNLPIGRDIVRRTRMTTRRSAGSEGVRSAVSHVHVVDRLATPYGPFTLVEVAIETGRTHQIRVHLQALGHPVVGDNLYGAPHQIRLRADPSAPGLSLSRNYLHAARISLVHPRTGDPLLAEALLPSELTLFLAALRAGPAAAPIESTA